MQAASLTVSLVVIFTRAEDLNLTSIRGSGFPRNRTSPTVPRETLLAKVEPEHSLQNAATPSLTAKHEWAACLGARQK